MLRKLCSALILFTASAQAFGTTIVFRRYGSSILIAADTRGETASDNVAAGVGEYGHAISDKICKIVQLGGIGFAVTGAIDYKKTHRTDLLDDWNALADANAAFNANGDNLNMVADDWALRSVSHYQAFYNIYPQRVVKIAEGHSHLLELGLFFEWQNGTPRVLAKIIQFDPDQPSPVFSSEKVVIITNNEMSTNNITQELIDGKTAAAKKASAQWSKRSRRLYPSELAWKHLQFLIKETSSMDRTVSPESDIMRIPETGKPSWILTSGCNQ